MSEDTVVTLTLSPSVDHSVTVERWVKNRTNRPVAFRRDPGGKGINVSRVVHRLGGPTLACGFAGGAVGELIRRSLDSEGVPHALTPVQGETRINTIITDLSDGTQTRLNLAGPEVTPDELEALYRELDGLPDPKWVVMGGSLPRGVPVEIYETLTHALKARGARVVLDADDEPLRRGVRAMPYLVKPNEFEVADLVGERPRSLEEFVEAAEKLAGQIAEVVVVSMGEQGAVAAAAGRVLRARAPHVQMLSAVGAGDSMVAAMVLSLSRGEPLADALRWGTAAGAAAVLTPGTDLCRPEDVRRLLQEVSVETM